MAAWGLSLFFRAVLPTNIYAAFNYQFLASSFSDSGKQLMFDVTMNIRQAEVTTLNTVGQLFMVQTKCV